VSQAYECMQAADGGNTMREKIDKRRICYFCDRDITNAPDYKLIFHSFTGKWFCGDACFDGAIDMAAELEDKS